MVNFQLQIYHLKFSMPLVTLSPHDDFTKAKAPNMVGAFGIVQLSFHRLLLARGFLPFGTGLALLAALHAHAALLAFASRHKTPVCCLLR